MKHSIFILIASFLFIISGVFVSCNKSNPSSPIQSCAKDDNLFGSWKGTMQGDTSSFIFSTTSFTWSERDGYPEEAYSYSGQYCTDTNTNPKNLDLTIQSSSENEPLGKLQMLIYKISQDSLWVCGPPPGIPIRATKFTSDSFVTYILIKQN